MSRARKCLRSRQLRKRVQLEPGGLRGGGFTTVLDGTEEYAVTLEIDQEALADWLHAKAACSKRGVSTACAGAVKCKVVPGSRGTTNGGPTDEH